MMVLRVFACVLALAWASQGLPGGGTSLLINSTAPVAIAPQFTGLANATAFSVEVWYNAFLSGYEGYILQMAVSGSTELFTLYVAEGAAASNP